MKALMITWLMVSGAWSSFLMVWIGAGIIGSGILTQEEPRPAVERQALSAYTPPVPVNVNAPVVKTSAGNSKNSEEPVTDSPKVKAKPKKISSAALAALQAQTQIPKVEFKLPGPGEVWTGEMIFETRCIVCHSLDVPKAQKLDRQTWSWVVGEMQKKYHVPLTDEEKEKLLDFVSTSYGPVSN